MAKRRKKSRRFGDVAVDLARAGKCGAAKSALRAMKPGIRRDYEAEMVADLCAIGPGGASFSGKRKRGFGSAGGKPFVAVAVDHRGIVHGTWEAATVTAAMAAADANAGKAYTVTVRADRTSDGTLWGAGKGRVEAVREHGKWLRY